jgi:hypothetical protein
MENDLSLGLSALVTIGVFCGIIGVVIYSDTPYQNQPPVEHTPAISGKLDTIGQEGYNGSLDTDLLPWPTSTPEPTYCSPDDVYQALTEKDYIITNVGYNTNNNEKWFTDEKWFIDRTIDVINTQGQNLTWELWYGKVQTGNYDIFYTFDKSTRSRTGLVIPDHLVEQESADDKIAYLTRIGDTDQYFHITGTRTTRSQAPHVNDITVTLFDPYTVIDACVPQF